MIKIFCSNSGSYFAVVAAPVLLINEYIKRAARLEIHILKGLVFNLHVRHEYSSRELKCKESKQYKL